MQLSWNYNYAPAGVALRPVVNDPNLDLLAASDPKLAFATAIYFWMTPRENKPSCHDVMVDKWQPTAADIDGNRLPGFGVTTNIINGGLECNIPGNVAVEDRVKYYERYSGILGVSPGQNLYCGDQRPFGQDASFALASSSYKSASGGEAAAGVVRVDKKGRTCSDLGKKACKRKRWCKFSTTTQTCEGGASDPVAATSTQLTGTTAVKVDRKGRTCADFGKRKCNRKSWCAYDVTSRTCQDTGACGRCRCPDGPQGPHLRRLREAQVQPEVVVRLRLHQQDMPGHRCRRGLGGGCGRCRCPCDGPQGPDLCRLRKGPLPEAEAVLLQQRKWGLRRQKSKLSSGLGAGHGRVG